MPLKIGDTAPDFTLKNQDGQDVSLRNFRDKNVVLLFFPFANSSTCTTEMKVIRDNIKKFENLNSEVIGISVDSHYALKMWSEKNNFNFNLLSDFNKEVSPKYDSLYDVFAPGKYDYNGVSKRSAFVIDKEGKIQHMEICATPGHQPNYEEIEEILEKLNKE